MVPARLASKQAAASSMQLGPQGPRRSPGQQGSRNGKQMLPHYPGWVSATFLYFTFWPTGPPRAGNRRIPGGGLGPWHISGRKRENKFPGSRGTFGGEIRLPQMFVPESGTFLHFYVLADRTPTGRKSQNTGFVGHLGLRRPLALGGIPDLGRKRKNTISLGTSWTWAENGKTHFPGGRGTFQEKIRRPQKFLPESAQPFYLLRSG